MSQPLSTHRQVGIFYETKEVQEIRIKKDQVTDQKVNGLVVGIIGSIVTTVGGAILLLAFIGTIPHASLVIYATAGVLSATGLGVIGIGEFYIAKVIRTIRKEINDIEAKELTQQMLDYILTDINHDDDDQGSRQTKLVNFITTLDDKPFYLILNEAQNKFVTTIPDDQQLSTTAENGKLSSQKLWEAVLSAYSTDTNISRIHAQTNVGGTDFTIDNRCLKQIYEKYIERIVQEGADGADTREVVDTFMSLLESKSNNETSLFMEALKDKNSNFYEKVFYQMWVNSEKSNFNFSIMQDPKFLKVCYKTFIRLELSKDSSDNKEVAITSFAAELKKMKEEEIKEFMKILFDEHNNYNNQSTENRSLTVYQKTFFKLFDQVLDLDEPKFANFLRSDVDTLLIYIRSMDNGNLTSLETDRLGFVFKVMETSNKLNLMSQIFYLYKEKGEINESNGYDILFITLSRQLEASEHAQFVSVLELSNHIAAIASMQNDSEDQIFKIYTMIYEHSTVEAMMSSENFIKQLPKNSPVVSSILKYHEDQKSEVPGAILDHPESIASHYAPIEDNYPFVGGLFSKMSSDNQAAFLNKLQAENYLRLQAFVGKVIASAERVPSVVLDCSRAVACYFDDTHLNYDYTQMFPVYDQMSIEQKTNFLEELSKDSTKLNGFVAAKLKASEKVSLEDARLLAKFPMELGYAVRKIPDKELKIDRVSLIFNQIDKDKIPEFFNAVFKTDINDPIEPSDEEFSFDNSIHILLMVIIQNASDELNLSNQRIHQTIHQYLPKVFAHTLNHLGKVDPEKFLIAFSSLTKDQKASYLNKLSEEEIINIICKFSERDLNSQKVIDSILEAAPLLVKPMREFLAPKGIETKETINSKSRKLLSDELKKRTLLKIDTLKGALGKAKDQFSTLGTLDAKFAEWVNDEEIYSFSFEGISRGFMLKIFTYMKSVTLQKYLSSIPLDYFNAYLKTIVEKFDSTNTEECRVLKIMAQADFMKSTNQYEALLTLLNKEATVSGTNINDDLKEAIIQLGKDKRFAEFYNSKTTKFLGGSDPERVKMWAPLKTIIDSKK